jgi:hypothetical protein
MGKNWLTPGEFLLSIWNDAVKPVARWQQTYQDSNNPAMFREWLSMLLDARRRYDVGEGYAFSPVSEHAGLMTYRYFRLFTLGDAVFRDERLSTPEGLAEFDRDGNTASGMIRMESLEDDFIRILVDAGYTLSEEQVSEIRARAAAKTNVSSRRMAGYYYDPDSIQLVAEREQYLIGKYGYEPPTLQD